MAESIHVVGKTKLMTSTDVIGQTDENNDISIQIYPCEKIVRTNESGPHLDAKVINLGEYAIIRVPLISWDDSVLDPILKRAADTLGQIGALGTDVPLTSITISPTITGSTIYTFPKCRIIDNFELTKWGYEAQRKVVVFRAIPDPSALSTATTALYTTQTVS